MWRSRVCYFFDFALCPPLAIGFARFATMDAVAPNLALAAFWSLAGLAAWTFIEYWVHRALFHHAPILRAMHATHHTRPDLLEGSPPAILPFALIIVAGPAIPAFGAAAYSSLVAGLLTGYLGYSFMHYAAHHLRFGGQGYAARAKRWHMLHHFGPMDRNFGVTSGFWDRAFGTAADVPPARAAARDHDRGATA